MAWTLVAHTSQPAEGDLQEVIVSATLRPTPAVAIPGSVTVLDEQTLQEAGRANFEDVLGLIPNLNWSGDTSLPRYFSAARYRRTRTVPGCTQPLGGFSDR
jgi:iron complex outermembrane recepter protein